MKAQLKGEADFGHMGLAVELGLLLLKRQATSEPTLTASGLWERVWRRTDDDSVRPRAC